MSIQNNSAATATTANYAATKNARFSMTQSQIRTIKQRWDETFNSLPVIQQKAVIYQLNAAIAEFRRRNPNIKGTKDLKKQLAKAWTVSMDKVCIDDTMQRQLNIAWVMVLLNAFVATKVIPIHVYQPDPAVEIYSAWDGQHTLVLLWLICTQVFAEDPANFEIPVNVYASHLKSEMRGCFIDLNSEEGKKMLDLYDKMEQMIYGVRVDLSTNPLWKSVEKKQQIVEQHGLFLTSKKFGDDDQPGAISRMQEVNKLTEEPLTWLCDYLVAVGCQTRPVEEKEIVLMAYFFERCRLAKLNLTQANVFDIANLAKNHWGADFSPTSIFWAKSGNAYRNWHAKHVVYGNPRFNKEPIHGYPFFVEQLKKELPGFAKLDSSTSSEFIPDAGDLF
jgi:bifunctional DNase/RNase